MGAQCVKPSSKPPRNKHIERMGSLQCQLRRCQQLLHFAMTIEHLKLTNMTDVIVSQVLQKVKEIKFSLQSQFEIIYSLPQFSVQENLIKSQKIHKAQFSFPANKLDSKKLHVQIINHQNQTIQTIKLKLMHLCTGPVHHDHLLKQLKARLMFDLNLYQNINIDAKCKSLKISLNKNNQTQINDLAYQLNLITDVEEKYFSSFEGFWKNQQNFQEQSLEANIQNNILKEANFRIDIIKNKRASDISWQQSSVVIYSMFIPYRMIQNYETSTTLRRNQIDYVRKVISFNDKIKENGNTIGSFSFDLEVCSSLLYAQQMQCLIFSQIGVSSVSPTLTGQSQQILIKQLRNIYSNVIKIKNFTSKSTIINNMDDIYKNIQKSNSQIFTSQQQLYERQITLVKLLNQLSDLFQQGQDMLNQRLWRIINYIVHKPELTPRYLTLHQNQGSKIQLYLKYYKFIINVLLKIISSTSSGITYHQLQCIQKFIAFSYFRFPWIQQKIVKCLKKENDPAISQQKLIQIGAHRGYKSPSKSYIYDWEVNIYKKIEQHEELKQLISKLLKQSHKYQGWDNLLFNRSSEDLDLFYGIYLEIWSQAEFTLKNLRNKILWEYFPYYSELLSYFLGQMNNSNISQYSPLFKACSNKLILNEKLLNTFLLQLFPKTYLYEISCVFKCLNLLESYFDVLMKDNKKLPNDFNVNIFYTGIKTIFEQNHSFLVVKTLLILYKYYEIFTLDFKKTLNSFLLSSIFYHLFLHWCSNVRKMFHHLLYFKILQRKISNPEENIINKIKQLKQNQQNKFQQQVLFGPKLHIFLRTIQNVSYQLKKQKDSIKSNSKKPYYEIMKDKLAQKKRLKKSGSQKDASNFSELSSQSDLTNFRKKSFEDLNDLCLLKIRRMSVTDELYCDRIDDKYKKYCLISLKEYEEIRKTQNSNKQIEKLAKMFQSGDIDI